MKNRYAIYLSVIALASCGPAPNDPGPGGVTVGEAKALDDAAEMLDERNINIAPEHEATKSKPAPR